ncbi:MAG: hypothetical protein DRJ51_04305 [Thermoprotei archaeon]|nr:MAG: hypothetical protein DRJ36_03270 [Thermoprotei archaeon]RLE81188.1 MAG: hypothetical protein DRJ51_04305 [Thermoprotei archaeon]RLF01852.1 MAG: hypothetical protein DRJ59_05145 [Thermoprotei archaeon]
MKRLKHLLLLLLIIAVFLAERTLSSKPPWFKKGVYVEYRITDSIASKEIYTVSPEALVALKILYKYEVKYGNYTIVVYTDLSLEEVRERLEEMFKERKPRAPQTVTMFSKGLYEKIKALAQEGRLPLVIKKHYTHYCTTLFHIIDVKYYWKCMGFRNGLALIEVGFIGKIKKFDMQTETWQYSFINHTFTFLLDPDTRKAYTLGGEYLGVVPYWISGIERTFLLYEMFGITVNGTIKEEGVANTPLGKFDVYYVWAPATLWTFPFKQAAFEKVTGLLVKTHEYCDPVLKHFMNIAGISCSKNGVFVISRVQNIDISRGYGFQVEEKLIVIGLALLCIPLIFILMKVLKKPKP